MAVISILRTMYVEHTVLLMIIVKLSLDCMDIESTRFGSAFRSNFKIIKYSKHPSNKDQNNLVNSWNTTASTTRNQDEGKKKW